MGINMGLIECCFVIVFILFLTILLVSHHIRTNVIAGGVRWHEQ